MTTFTYKGGAETGDVEVINMYGTIFTVGKPVEVTDLFMMRKLRGMAKFFDEKPEAEDATAKRDRDRLAADVARMEELKRVEEAAKSPPQSAPTAQVTAALMREREAHADEVDAKRGAGTKGQATAARSGQPPDFTARVEDVMNSGHPLQWHLDDMAKEGWSEPERDAFRAAVKNAERLSSTQKTAAVTKEPADDHGSTTGRADAAEGRAQPDSERKPAVDSDAGLDPNRRRDGAPVPRR